MEEKGEQSWETRADNDNVEVTGQYGHMTSIMKGRTINNPGMGNKHVQVAAMKNNTHQTLPDQYS